VGLGLNRQALFHFTLDPAANFLVKAVFSPDLRLQKLFRTLNSIPSHPHLIHPPPPYTHLPSVLLIIDRQSQIWPTQPQLSSPLWACKFNPYLPACDCQHGMADIKKHHQQVPINLNWYQSMVLACLGPPWAVREARLGFNGDAAWISGIIDHRLQGPGWLFNHRPPFVIDFLSMFIFWRNVYNPTTVHLDWSDNFGTVYNRYRYWHAITVGGVSAAVSKTAAAPIERVKLLIQNQVCSFYHTTAFCAPDPSLPDDVHVTH